MNLHLWQQDWKTIQKKYPYWQLETYNGIPTAIKGNLRLFQGNCYVGDYDIVIEIPKTYPHSFPLLFETSGKIPKIVDRHIYTNTGGCCVEITHNQHIVAHKGIKICEFIDKYAIPYFLNDIHFVVCGTYANGEWKHGFEGHWQFYTEILKSKNVDIILKILRYLLIPPPQMPKLCICGSGRKFKSCHGHQISILKLVNREVLLNDYNIILRFISLNAIYTDLLLTTFLAQSLLCEKKLQQN